MNRQHSPFASLTGIEKQIKWLEYQSIRLPYVNTDAISVEEKNDLHVQRTKSEITEEKRRNSFPVPPPEIPRKITAENYACHHRQYDAVIARMKQAELRCGQTRTIEL